MPDYENDSVVRPGKIFVVINVLEVKFFKGVKPNMNPKPIKNLAKEGLDDGIVSICYREFDAQSRSTYLRNGAIAWSSWEISMPTDVLLDDGRKSEHYNAAIQIDARFASKNGNEPRMLSGVFQLFSVANPNTYNIEIAGEDLTLVFVVETKIKSVTENADVADQVNGDPTIPFLVDIPEFAEAKTELQTGSKLLISVNSTGKGGKSVLKTWTGLKITDTKSLSAIKLCINKGIIDSDSNFLFRDTSSIPRIATRNSKGGILLDVVGTLDAEKRVSFIRGILELLVPLHDEKIVYGMLNSYGIGFKDNGVALFNSDNIRLVNYTRCLFENSDIFRVEKIFKEEMYDDGVEGNIARTGKDLYDLFVTLCILFIPNLITKLENNRIPVKWRKYIDAFDTGLGEFMYNLSDVFSTSRTARNLLNSPYLNPDIKDKWMKKNNFPKAIDNTIPTDYRQMNDLVWRVMNQLQNVTVLRNFDTRAFFEKYDTNGDEKLSMEELATGILKEIKRYAKEEENISYDDMKKGLNNIYKENTSIVENLLDFESFKHMVNTERAIFRSNLSYKANDFIVKSDKIKNAPQTSDTWINAKVLFKNKDFMDIEKEFIKDVCGKKDFKAGRLQSMLSFDPPQYNNYGASPELSADSNVGIHLDYCSMVRGQDCLKTTSNTTITE